MINIQTVKESYQKEEQNDVAYIRSEHNKGNALTSVKSHCDTTKTIISGKIEQPIEKWTI